MMLKGFLSSITHLVWGAIGLCWGWVAGWVEELSPMLIAGCLFCALLPDIDTTSSIVGRLFYPFAKHIEGEYGHRTITHSLIAIITVCVICVSLFDFLAFGVWLLVGYVSHIVLDMVVGDGVPLFYPARIRFEMARVKSGGDGEWAVMALGVFFAFIPFAIPNEIHAVITPPLITPEPHELRINNLRSLSDLFITTGDEITRGEIIARNRLGYVRSDVSGTAHKITCSQSGNETSCQIFVLPQLADD